MIANTIPTLSYPRLTSALNEWSNDLILRLQQPDIQEPEIEEIMLDAIATARLDERHGLPLEAATIWGLLGGRSLRRGKEAGVPNAIRYFEEAARLSRGEAGARADGIFSAARLGFALAYTRLPLNDLEENLEETRHQVGYAMREATARCPTDPTWVGHRFDLVSIWGELMANRALSPAISRRDVRSARRLAESLAATLPSVGTDRRYLAAFTLGLALVRLGERNAGITTLLRAAHMASMIGDQFFRGLSLSQAASAKRTGGRPDGPQVAQLQEEAGRAFTAAGEAVGAADANRAAAMVYLELGMWAEAATVLQRSADAGEVALSDARLDPEVKARTIEVAHAQQALALCLVHLGRNAEAAVAADRARARRLRSIPRMSDPGFRIVRAGDPQLADEYLSIQTSIRAAEIEEMQIRIRHRKGGLERLSVLTDELSAARAKRRAITERMRAVPGVAELLMPVVTLDRIRAALPLAAWAVYIIPSPYGGVAIAIGPDQVIAVQLPSLTHRAVSRRLRSITEAYDVIRGTSERPPDPRGRTAWSAEIEGIGKWLWQVCMGPILAACPGAERLVILAANGLDFLPLHAAWRLGADGVREYAIDCVQISYAPCSDLMPAPELVRDSLAGDSLAVADPAPTSEIPLRGARIEGVAISNALGSSTLLAGPEASIEAVAQLLPKMDVIHFACHARTEVGIPYSSFLLLACNGRLTVSDVVDLNLDRRPSVFLSACETNLHDFERADEVQSLSAAFLAAGARDVISTLWTVEDVSSTILALMFYDRRRAGLGGAAALRYAQRWLRDTSKPTKLNVLAAMAWIPPEVRNDVVDSLTFSSEDHSRPEHWAAHVYSGP